MMNRLYSRHKNVEDWTDEFRYFADGYQGEIGHRLYMEHYAWLLVQEIIRALKKDAAEG